MDSLTHVYFAHKLLSMSGGNVSAAVCSLFPQIDREPAYYHRMYAHPFFQVSRILDIGMQFHGKQVIPTGLEKDYEWQRFHNDYRRMRSFVERFESETGERISRFDPDKLSATIGYVSHTYQDMFNNPIQGFLPHWTYPSGQWSLWAEVGAIEFRTVLYAPETIAAFREEFFSAPLWQESLGGSALVRAMVRRTAASCVVDVPPEVVEDAFQSLGLVDDVDSGDVQMAEEWLIAHEALLSEMIRKYSIPGVHIERPALHVVPEIS